MKGYDIGYNLTEEVRQLLDADYKNDIIVFDTAKQHILELLGRELTEMDEYTKKRNELIEEYFKAEDKIKDSPRTLETIQTKSQNLYLFNQADAGIARQYMNDVRQELLRIANGNK